MHETADYKTDTQRRPDENLLKSIFDIILKNGMKSTTMDFVAATLSISKRTLYEIFDSKEEMLKIVLSHFHKKHEEAMEEIFNSSSSMMEAFYLVLEKHREIMRKASSAFYSDMDAAFKKLRNVYDSQTQVWITHMLNAIQTGIIQGVFSEDINYNIIIRLLRLQMESLKRMEEFFPDDISPEEAYYTISISFLRSIATSKGLEILNRIKSDRPFSSEIRQQ